MTMFSRHDRCASGLPPTPVWGDPEPPSLLDPKKRESEGHVPQWGVGLAPLAKRILIITIALTVNCTTALAAGSGMPWEAPLQRILESIEGPVAKVSAVVIIIITGLSLSFGDMSGGFRRLIQIVFGLSIAFAATSFFLSFFSFAGGAVIN